MPTSGGLTVATASRRRAADRLHAVRLQPAVSRPTVRAWRSARDRTGYHEIWVCGRRTAAAPAQLTRFGGPLTGTPRWSPDGRWIAFDSRPEGQADIYVIPVRRAAPRGASPPRRPRMWCRAGAATASGCTSPPTAAGPGRCGRRPSRAARKVQVTRNGGFAAFESPDGRWLYYALGRGVPGLYRMPVEGGGRARCCRA